MTKTILKCVAVGLALVVTVILVLYLNRSDPYGPLPGKRLLGEEVSEPIGDWSFTGQARSITIEVRPSDPYSVNTSCLLHDGVFHVLAANVENRWVQFLHQDPDMRFKMEGKLYPARATMVEDPARIEELFKALEQKYGGFARRTPEERTRYRLFRIDSR